MTHRRLGLLLLCFAPPALGCLQTVDEALPGASGGGVTTGTGGTGTTGVGTSGAGTTSGASSTGGSAGQICNQLIAGLQGLTTNFPGCDLSMYIGMAPTDAACLSAISACSPSDLSDLQTFLTCVGNAAPVNCATSPMGITALYGELLPCLSSYQLVSSACQAAILSGASATNGGSTTSTGTTGSGTGSGTSSAGAGTSSGGSGAGFCAPCATDAQCGGANACLSAPGAQGTYCGSDCSQGQVCPAGSRCATAVNAAGNQVVQCAPAACARGVGLCTPCGTDRACGAGNGCLAGGCALDCSQGQTCPGSSSCTDATLMNGRQTLLCVAPSCGFLDGGLPAPDAGGPGLVQTCSDLIAAEVYSTANFPGCGISATPPTQTGCEASEAVCSSSDLGTLDAFALCISQVPPTSCTGNPLAALQVVQSFRACQTQSGLNNVSQACLLGLAGPPGGDAG